MKYLTKIRRKNCIACGNKITTGLLNYGNVRKTGDFIRHAFHMGKSNLSVASFFFTNFEIFQIYTQKQASSTEFNNEETRFAAYELKVSSFSKAELEIFLKVAKFNFGAALVRTLNNFSSVWW